MKENGVWKAQIDIILRSGMAMGAPEGEDSRLVPRRAFFFLGGPRRA